MKSRQCGAFLMAGALLLVGILLTMLVNTRFWAHINDQPGNCWKSAP